MTIPQYRPRPPKPSARKLLYAILVPFFLVVILLGGFKAVDSYGDWRWTDRCVKHHADYCNNDGDGDTGKPWWAKNRENSYNR